jgi:hypothetical protein
MSHFEVTCSRIHSTSASCVASFSDRAREAHKFGFGQSLQKRGASTRPTTVAAATREHSIRHGTGPTQRAQTVAAGRHRERWAPRTRPSGPSRCRRRRRPGAAPPSRCSPLRAPLSPGRRRLPDVRNCAPPYVRRTHPLYVLLRTVVAGLSERSRGVGRPQVAQVANTPEHAAARAL